MTWTIKTIVQTGIMQGIIGAQGTPKGRCPRALPGLSSWVVGLDCFQTLCGRDLAGGIFQLIQGPE